MSDFYKMVTDKEGEFQALFARMDTDKELLIQKEFTLFDKDDREAPDVENLTLNDAAVFAARVQANLIGANMQTVVEGEKLKDEETHLFEDFFRDYTLAVDGDLQMKDIPSLMAWNVQQILGRGRVASRVTLTMDGDKFIHGILPLDTRYLIYDYGVKGLKWVAYKTQRTKDQVFDEYAIELNKSNAIITDLWIDEEEIVFIEKDIVKQEKHGFDELPFVIQVCPLGLMFQDDDRILYNGESIFYLNRNLYEAKNKVASILNTLNMYSLFGGLQYESEAGILAKRPEKPPYGKRFVIPVDKGGGYKPMPVSDIRMATRLLYSILDSAIQDGSLARISYGTLQFPLSAVGMAELKEAEDPVYLPRLQALSLYYQRLYRMVLNQYVGRKMNVQLGEPGFQKEYPWAKLDKPVSITFKFFATSAKQRIANTSVATAEKALGLPEDWIFRNTLELENPTEVISQRRAELAEKIDPAIALYKLAHSLLDEEQEIEAELILQQLETMLRQRNQPRMPQPPLQAPGAMQRALSEEPKQLRPGETLLPLLGKGGQRPRVPAEKLPEVEEE